MTVNGDHIVVLDNGWKVVDAHKSTLASGAIGLQSAHPVDLPGAKVEFRNLSPAPSPLRSAVRIASGSGDTKTTSQS